MVRGKGRKSKKLKKYYGEELAEKLDEERQKNVKAKSEAA